MQIKVTRIEDGPAKVEVVNPNTGETLSCTEVNVGQEVTVALPNAHSPEDVQVGEVCGTEEAAETTEEPGGESEGGEPAGEAEGGEPGGEEPGSGE